MKKTKLELVLAIVEWEHRYKHGELKGGAWCIERIRHLMRCYSREGLAEQYRDGVVEGDGPGIFPGTRED